MTGAIAGPWPPGCAGLPAIAAPDRVFSDMLPWLAVLVAVVIVGGVVAFLLRRALRSGTTSRGEGFTLHDLREMRAAGLLSEEEFERAREAIIERVRPRPSENPDAGDAGDATESG